MLKPCGRLNVNNVKVHFVRLALRTSNTSAGDGRRIIRGWPASPESLYDAFSKASGKSSALLQHSTHFWHIIVGSERERKRVFSIFYLRQCGSRYFPPCCLTAGSWEHLKSLQESHSHLSKDSLSLSLSCSLCCKFNRDHVEMIVE